MPTLCYQSVGFLTQQHRAASLWHQMIVHGEQVWAPPDLEHLPAQQRAQWLAHEQATRLARARLYHLDEAGTDLATRVGAELRAGTVPMPWPPSQYGMVLCPNGLGYSQDGMPLIACHWSPLQGTPGWARYWLTWWADTRELLEWIHQEHGSDVSNALHLFGPLPRWAGARPAAG